MAMGGSTNTILHTLAIAREAGVDYPLARINEVADRVPHLCKVAPSGPWHMDDVHRAGGVPAILATLASQRDTLHLDRPTVSGTLRAGLGNAQVEDARGHPAAARTRTARAAAWPSCSATWPRRARW